MARRCSDVRKVLFDFSLEVCPCGPSNELFLPFLFCPTLGFGRDGIDGANIDYVMRNDFNLGLIHASGSFVASPDP